MMKMVTQLLLLLIHLPIILAYQCECGKNNSTAAFGFLYKPAKWAIGCNSMSQDLCCCVTGYDSPPNMTWQFCGKKGSNLNCNVIPQQHDIEYPEQKLRFLGVYPSDAGYYKCVVQYGSNIISNTVQLFVIGQSSCGIPSGPSLVLEPTANYTTVHQKKGETVNLNCTMNVQKIYNCSNTNLDPDQMIFWSWVNTSAVHSNKTRISQYDYQEKLHEACTSVLTIKQFSERDYGTYVCSNNNGHGSVARYFHVIKPENKVDKYKLGFLLTVTILGLFVLLGSLLWTCRLDLQIWWKTRVMVIPKHSPDLPYDVLLLYGDSQRRFAEEVILERLNTILPDKAGGYAVQSCSDLYGDYVTAYSKALSQCACVVVVVSRSLLQTNFALRSLIPTIGEKHVIFIVYEEIAESEWDKTHDAEALRLALRTDRVLRWKSPPDENLPRPPSTTSCCVTTRRVQWTTIDKQQRTYETKFIKQLYVMLLKLKIPPQKGKPLESQPFHSHTKAHSDSGEELLDDVKIDLENVNSTKCDNTFKNMTNLDEPRSSREMDTFPAFMSNQNSSENAGTVQPKSDLSIDLSSDDKNDKSIDKEPEESSNAAAKSESASYNDSQFVEQNEGKGAGYGGREDHIVKHSNTSQICNPDKHYNQIPNPNLSLSSSSIEPLLA